MNKKVWLMWIKLISFILVILGGINWLFYGLFECDIIGTLFGGMDSVTSRVLYTLVGVGAVVLGAIVIVKAFYEKKKPAAKSSASKSTAQKSETTHSVSHSATQNSHD